MSKKSINQYIQYFNINDSDGKINSIPNKILPIYRSLISFAWNLEFFTYFILANRTSTVYCEDVIIVFAFK